jgi:hypothetical protein
VSDFAALDVAIGLVFVFFLLSLVCSAINELVAAALHWRPAMLAEGVENLLSGTSKVTAEGRALSRAMHEHPLIQGLVRPGSHRWPSYVPSRTFVSALLSLGSTPGTVAGAERSVQESIDAIQNQHVRDALTGLLSRAGGDARRFEALAAEWFDDAMERVSGWYRRKVQVALVVIAALLVVALNVDSVQIASGLWSDNSVRRAVVASAGARAAAADGPDACPSPGACVEQVAATVEQLDALEIPLGWRGPNEPRWDDWAWYPSKLIGLVLTVAALSLGAPFWFDLLSKVARLRASGAPPPTTDAVRIGEGEEKRAGPTATAAPEEPH